MRRVLLILLVLVTACAGRPAPDATGSAVYSSVCSHCHGADLEGGVGPALGAGSQVPDLPDEYLTRVITDGKGPMPAFGPTLTADQISRVIAYLRAEASS